MQPMTTIVVRWFRDQGRGQEAALAMGASESMEGAWPVATLHASSMADSGRLFMDLYTRFGIQATTHISWKGETR